MRRLTALLLGATLLALSGEAVAQGLPGLEFGINLDNSTTVVRELDQDSLTYRQRDVVAGWLSYRLTGQMYLDLVTSVTFSVDDPILVDLDILSLNGVYPFFDREDILFGLDIGRIQFSDQTDEVFRHVMDGGVVRLEYPGFEVRLGAGYTGFIQRPASNVTVSTADRIDMADEDLQFGPARFLGSIDVQFPEVFIRQTVFLGFLSQLDLRPSDDGDRINTQYLSAGVAGPILSGLFYDLSGVLGLGTSEDASFEDEFYSVAFNGGLRYYLPGLLNSRFSVRGFYGSGDDDSFTRFVPVTPKTRGIVFEAEPANLTTLSAGYSLRPFSYRPYHTLENILVGIDSTAFFRSSDGFIADPAFNPESDERFLGHEVTGRIVVRVFSDVGAALTVGAFFPNAGRDKPFFSDERDTEMLARFELSIAL